MHFVGFAMKKKWDITFLIFEIFENKNVKIFGAFSRICEIIMWSL